MTGFWHKWNENRNRMICIFMICLGYIGIMIGIYLYYRNRVTLAPVQFMAAVFLVSAAAVSVACIFSLYETRGKNRRLYELLSEFKDTIIFEYHCRDGSLHLSSNAAGQVELSAIRQGLERFVKMRRSVARDVHLNSV